MKNFKKGSNKKVRFISCIIPVSLLCIILNTGGAEETLVWEECVNEAINNNPDLVAAREKINQAKANKTIAASNLYPRISADISERTSKYGSTANTISPAVR